MKRSFAEEAPISRIKQTVRNGGTMQLIINREQDEIYDSIIDIALPPKNHMLSSPNQADTPNLNSLIDKLGNKVCAEGSIAYKIQHLVAECFNKPCEGSLKGSNEVVSCGSKINSLPIYRSNSTK